MSDELTPDYVEGDINHVGGAIAPLSTAVLEYLASALADDPAAVRIDVARRHDKAVLSLSVGPDDMGRIIGRRGRTAQALRTLVAAAGSREGVTTSVDIVD